MGTMVMRDDCIFCAQCGNHSAEVLYEDFSGYEQETTTCANCGYCIVIDVGCGGRDEASWYANRKDGVIVLGFERENGQAVDFNCVPGSLVGALATKSVCDAKNLAFLWVAFVTEDSFTHVEGVCPAEFDIMRSAVSARRLLNSIDVRTALAA